MSQKVAVDALSGNWGVPIRIRGKDGDGAMLPGWLSKWNGYATELGEEYIVTPKMFSGTKSVDGKLTGIAQGKECITIDGVKRTGIFALVDNEVVFELDPITKKYLFKGRVEADSGSFKGDIEALTGKFGNLKIDGNDLISIKDGQEKMRITLDAIPSIENLFSDNWASIVTDGNGGLVENPNPSIKNQVYNAAHFYNGRDEWPDDDNSYFECYVNFNIPVTAMTQIQAGSWLSLESGEFFGRIRCLGKIVKVGGETIVDSFDFYQNIFKQTLTNGDYRITFRFFADQEYKRSDWAGRMLFDISGVIYRTSPKKTIIGGDGIASVFGSEKYFHFSEGLGFEVKNGLGGFRVLGNNPQVCKNGTWIDL